MAAFQIIALDTVTPQLRAPGTGDTYSAPRAIALAPETLTGSSATTSLDIAQTWNTTGTPTALKLNVTDTASNAASLLMDLQVGGTSRLAVRKDGNVGIGTSSPGAKLDVVGGAIRWGNASSVIGTLNYDGSGVYAGSTTATPLILVVGNTERMRITATGDVGIGTTNPSSFLGKLAVIGNITAANGGKLYQFDSTNSTGRYMQAVSNHGLSIGKYDAGDVEQVRITAAGNVGIGTSSPSAKLAVSNAGAEGFEVSPTGGVGGGAIIATYNRSTSAYTSLTTYSSTMTWYANGSTRAMDLDATGSLLVGTATNTYGYAGSPSIELNATDAALIALKKGGAAGSYISHNNVLNIFNTTANPIVLATSNTERMRITAAGDVGIGTSTPLTAATIGRGAGVAGYLSLYGNNGVGSALYVGQDTAGLSRIFQLGANPITIWTDSSERMRITATGDVGIGTSSINARFQVLGAGATPGAIVIGAGGASVNYFDANINVFRLGNQTETMRIDSGGNVGIGTSSPLTGLHFNKASSGTVTPLANAVDRGFIIADSAATNAGVQIGINGGSAAYLQARNNTGAGASAVGFAINPLGGNVQIGTASLATTATSGFPYIPTCAGTPTGTPTAITGYAPMVVDSTNNKLYVYVGGAWQVMN